MTKWMLVMVTISGGGPSADHIDIFDSIAECYVGKTKQEFEYGSQSLASQYPPPKKDDDANEDEDEDSTKRQMAQCERQKAKSKSQRQKASDKCKRQKAKDKRQM